jgi:hypothetical protein
MSFGSQSSHMNRLVPILALAFAGCGSNPAPTIPPTIGDFVRNNDGVATAQVFGITFRANTRSSGATTNDVIVANFLDPEMSSARKRFTIGDDIMIQLTSVDDSKVSFVFNDKDFGSLNIGDEVVIDDERNVEVNGTSRSPRPPE